MSLVVPFWLRCLLDCLLVGRFRVRWIEWRSAGTNDSVSRRVTRFSSTHRLCRQCEFGSKTQPSIYARSSYKEQTHKGLNTSIHNAAWFKTELYPGVRSKSKLIYTQHQFHAQRTTDIKRLTSGLTSFPNIKYPIYPMKA